MQAIKTMELVKQYKTLTAVDRLYLENCFLYWV